MNTSLKPIRALERGLLIFRALDNEAGRSLQQLHALTGMPKPTLLRLLHTLELNGFVWRAIGDGLYRRKVIMREPEAGPSKLQALGAIAGPFLESMQRKAIWPSDLLVVHNNRLVAVETARKRSGLRLDFYPIGTKVDFFLSAPGRAYLAWSTDKERERIIAYHRRHPPQNLRSQQVLERELPKLLTTIRQLGYAWRDPIWGGSHLPMAEFDDGLDAIAVPVMHGQRVLACLNLVWMRKYHLQDKLVREHLEDLKATARDIAQAAAPLVTRGR